MRLSMPLTLGLGGRRGYSLPAIPAGIALDGSGDYISTPAPASGPLDITGAIDIRLLFKVTDEDVESHIVAKDTSNRCYDLFVDTLASTYLFTFYTFGTDTLASGITDVQAALAGLSRSDLTSPTWLRVTREDVDGSNYLTKWFTSENGTDWTSMQEETKVGVFDIHSNSEEIRLFSRNLSSLYAEGTVMKFELRDGIDGTVVASPGFYDPAATSVTDAQSNVWTITKT